MQTINERFLIARKEKKLSQEAIGKLLHISGTAYSRIENGVNNPSAQTISLMCTELNFNEEWLRTGAGAMFVQSDNNLVAQLVQQYHFRPIEQKMLEAYVALPVEYRAGVVRYLETLVSTIVADAQAQKEAEAEKENAAIIERLNQAKCADDDINSEARA